MNNKKIFSERINKYIEKRTNRIIKKFADGEMLFNIIEPNIKKSFVKICFLDIKTIALLDAFSFIKNDPYLYKKLEKETFNAEDFCMSFYACEFYIYKIFKEIEKIIMLVNKQNM